MKGWRDGGYCLEWVAMEALFNEISEQRSEVCVPAMSLSRRAAQQRKQQGHSGNPCVCG